MPEVTVEAGREPSTEQAISSLVVRVLRSFTGRGPTRAWTSIRPELITVVLRDTLTKGERSLVEDGRGLLVIEMRKAYQLTMRDDLVNGIETITGRTVIAFLSDNHIDPDIAVESFVMGTAAVTNGRDVAGIVPTSPEEPVLPAPDP